MKYKLEDVKGAVLPTDDCINENTRPLYISLNEKNKVELFSNKEGDCWLIFYNANINEVPIIAGLDYPCVEYFTHELLHLYLYQNNFDKTIHEYIFACSKYLKAYIQQDTKAAIINNIAHYKMLPQFKKFKLDESKFLMSKALTVSREDINSLETQYNRLSKEYFDYFVHVFFDLRYCFSKELIATAMELLCKLKIIDNELFNILDTNCNNWEKDIDNYSNSGFWTDLILQLDDLLKISIQNNNDIKVCNTNDR